MDLINLNHKNHKQPLVIIIIIMITPTLNTILTLLTIIIIMIIPPLDTSGGNLLQNHLPSDGDYLPTVLEFTAIILPSVMS